MVLGRRPNGDWNVIDYNNASDENPHRLRAAEGGAALGPPPHRQAAQRIIRDIRTQLAVTVKDYRLIAPAYFGFNGDAGHVFNTGYLVLPAFAEFARVDNDVLWKRVLSDSWRLLERSAFSRFKLPADWVALENGRSRWIGPAAHFSDTRPSGCRSTWPGTAPGSAWRHLGIICSLWKTPVISPAGST